MIGRRSGGPQGGSDVTQRGLNSLSAFQVIGSGLCYGESLAISAVGLNSLSAFQVIGSEHGVRGPGHRVSCLNSLSAFQVIGSGTPGLVRALLRRVSIAFRLFK